MKMPIVVGQGACITGIGRIEVRIQINIVEIGIERGFLVVVIDFSVNDLKMANSQLEDVYA